VAQAWLGYYNSALRSLRWDKAELVAMANQHAQIVLRLVEPPMLEAKTVRAPPSCVAHGDTVMRAACKWSPELSAACEVWKEIKQWIRFISIKPFLFTAKGPFELGTFSCRGECCISTHAVYFPWSDRVWATVTAVAMRTKVHSTEPLAISLGEEEHPTKPLRSSELLRSALGGYIVFFLFFSRRVRCRVVGR
jgi:hypothetical protein